MRTFAARIKAIKRIDSEDRYDISVEGNENFFANNILVHNCRIIIVINENGKITCMSRNGKEFTTLDRLKEEIKECWPNLRSTVFDGEACIVDENGDEHFDQMIRLINKKDYTIAFPRHQIFDVLTLTEFLSATSNGSETLSKRLSRWEILKKQAVREPVLITMLRQIPVTSKEHLERMFKEANEKNWEGLILRRDTLYQGKRSNDLLKVKLFSDAEFIVKKVITGPFQMVVDGKEVTENVLASVEIEFEGSVVGVGSGFTIEQRRDFYFHPEHILGKTITVRYFEVTTDKNGKHSLRFPTIKAIYDNKRDI